MLQIDHVHAREVLDSRGKPTLEVEVKAGQLTGSAMVPSGASTGLFEAHELRDGDPDWYQGAGVQKAVRHVCEVIGPAIKGLHPADQVTLDQRLCEVDGTPHKSRLGANALLGVSLATARAGALAEGLRLDQHLWRLWTDFAGEQASPEFATKPRLPLPMVNMISGGLHAGGQVDFQDFLVIPVGATSYRQALEWIARIYRQLSQVLRLSGLEGVLVGDEGGYGPRVSSAEAALITLVESISQAGLQPGHDVWLALDVASSHFFDKGTYRLRTPVVRQLKSPGMVDYLAALVDEFPILSIEDGVSEDDWDGWKQLTDKLGERVQLVGDDLFVTNRIRLARGVQQGVANSVLIKVNQIGTLSETFATVKLALENGYRPVISARSGETEDPFLADLAVGLGAGQIKIGSVARSERLAKYNQLLRLEEWLGDEAEYIGGRIFQRWLTAERTGSTTSRKWLS